MTNSYGPWATAINVGRNPQLSAFWKSRLTMLVAASQTSPVLSRRNALGLVAGAVLICALPTLRAAPAVADVASTEEQPKPAASAPTAKERQGKPAAETVTLTRTNYERRYSKDGKRTWLVKNRITIAYLDPGFWRTTWHDQEGKVQWVEITDATNNKTLHLDMKSKKAIWMAYPQMQVRGKPVERYAESLKRNSIQLVGQRDVNGRIANVFRDHYSGDPTMSVDVWIDAESKQVVGRSEPGADVFDPRTLADRDNPAEKQVSKGTILGTISDNIVFDAPLDAKLFSLTPPEGFEVVQQPRFPPVTEAEMIEWLGVTARFNNGVFVDTPKGIDLEKHNEAAKKKADRTDVEQRFLDLWRKHVGKHHSYPIWDFSDECAVRGTFQYLGKGVKLGSGDRIVCWYKLKSTGTYRAVYGDLTVKDVAPKDLPLAVGE
jgi:hypothetical protein